MIESKTRFSKGFTLVELITCIGIIALLAAIMLPALSQVRASARTITCASNIRQIGQGMFAYAIANRGLLPMNIAAPKAYYWYDADRLGRILTPSQTFVMGPIATCPEDVGGIRSYAMNVWASCAMDSSVSGSGFGMPWRLTIKDASRYILVTEKWSSAGSYTAGWITSGPIASTKNTPGQRFGGGLGISPVLTSAHFGSVNCELPFARHRTTKSVARGTQPIGRVNIGYADGHVSLKSNSDLVDPQTGLSTLDSWWSPLDAAINY